MQKTGLIMSIEKKHVCVMTPSGDFIRIGIVERDIPIIGHIYTGTVVNGNTLKSNIFVKYRVIAAIFIFFVFICFGIYSYFTPVTVATIDINPSIKLFCNKYSKTISTNASNDDGKKILSQITLKNLNLDEALVKIVDQSIKDNFINSKYLVEKKISLKITGKDVSIVNFQEKLKQEKLNSKIKTNGKIKKIKINNNSKKIITNKEIKEIKGNSNNYDIKDEQNKLISYQTNVKLNNSVKSNNTTTSRDIKETQISNITKKRTEYTNIDRRKNINSNKSK